MTSEDSAPRGVSVYLLDDHEVVRWGLRALLTQYGFDVVGESGSAIEAAGQIGILQPDVAVLDLRLPDGTGVEVCRRVQEVAPATRVMLLTSFGADRESLFEAIHAGASGYVLKDVNHLQIVDAVRRVAAGQSFIDADLTESVLERIREPRGARIGPAHLTRTELTVLKHIYVGLTNNEIAQRMQLGERTVRTHVSSVLAKLGVSSRTKAAVVGQGLLEQVEP